jgi:TRAP-type C4-dicarboxylate transport system substrate-binding protein
VNILDETPKLPRDFDKLTPALKRGIEEEAVKIALANREKNRATREALEFYEAQGVLQIVEADEATA